MPFTDGRKVKAANAYVIGPMDIPAVPKMIREAGDQTPVYIFNVGPKEWLQELGSLGKHLIMKCPEGERYSIPHDLKGVIPECIAVEFKKFEYRHWDGVEVAQDILGLGPFKKQDQALTHWGCFISRSNPPKEEEIVAAEEMLTAKCLALVAEGDEFHNAGPQEYRNITADHRWALRKCNLNRAWGVATLVMDTCPGCQDSVKPGVVVHNCGAVLSWDKAIELGIKKASDRPKAEKEPKSA